MNLWWSPGQSDAAKEINRHLNGREKICTIILSSMFGLTIFAIPMIIMSSVTEVALFPEPFAGYGFPLVVFLAAVAWILLTLQRRILLGTQIAKDSGFTIADIKVKQPWSHKDYLIFGGFIALILISALISLFLIFA